MRIKKTKKKNNLLKSEALSLALFTTIQLYIAVKVKSLATMPRGFVCDLPCLIRNISFF